MIAVTLVSLAWIVARIALRQVGVDRARARDAAQRVSADGEASTESWAESWKDVAAQVLYPSLTTFDQVMLWAVLSGFALLHVAGVWAGLMREHAPTLNEIALRPIAAPGMAAWLLLAAAALARGSVRLMARLGIRAVG